MYCPSPSLTLCFDGQYIFYLQLDPDRGSVMIYGCENNFGVVHISTMMDQFTIMFTNHMINQRVWYWRCQHCMGHNVFHIKKNSIAEVIFKLCVVNIDFNTGWYNLTIINGWDLIPFLSCNYYFMVCKAITLA